MVVFQDFPNAIHGAIYVEKDIERKALQITLEEWSLDAGWSGGDPDKLLEIQKQELIKL